MINMEEKPGYYSILTADVRYDERLKKYADCKVLFSEITALSNKYGYCTASNGYFAKLYDRPKPTISKWINLLIKFGYLKSEMVYKENSKEIQGRRLYPITTPINAHVKGGINAHVKGGINAHVKDNITSINTINNNITTTTGPTEIGSIYEFWESNVDSLSPYLYEEIQAIYEDWSEVSKQPKEMILESIKMALDKGVRSISYIKAILKRWYDNRIYNIEDLKADQERFEKNKESKYNKQAKKGNAAGYDAKQWTYLSEEEEMRRFFGD
ncbi:DnaD domain protein [Ligilactobacillus salivarius]|uniref:DnaD domain protein n=1 Tax=Ligilactobacillus salivarius TaxID=1624 RepID=UPI0022E97954|nr:DnaD domain protein [Ligilactobacillus salivarius]